MSAVMAAAVRSGPAEPAAAENGGRPGVARHAHRPGEPRPVQRPLDARGATARTRQPVGGGVVDGPRRFQAGQRQPGSPRRGCVADPGRGEASRLRADLRHGGPGGRRRVRRVDGGPARALAAGRASRGRRVRRAVRHRRATAADAAQRRTRRGVRGQPGPVRGHAAQTGRRGDVFGQTLEVRRPAHLHTGHGPRRSERVRAADRVRAKAPNAVRRFGCSANCVTPSTTAT